MVQDKKERNTYTLGNNSSLIKLDTIKLISISLLSLLYIGCASFYKTTYYLGETSDSKYEKCPCEYSRGIKIELKSKSLYVCSKEQTGRELTTGILLPIFPAIKPYKWHDDLRWIKFGLKPESYIGFDNNDTLEIKLLSVDYNDSGKIYLSPKSSGKYNSKKYTNEQLKNVTFHILSQQDYWIGIPGTGKIKILFHIESYGNIKVELSPTTGYSYTFLTV